MKSKVLKRLFIVVTALVLAFAFSTTAFATGNNLSHSGWSKYGYNTNDYVAQMNDNVLRCTSATTSSGMQCYPYMDIGSGNQPLGQAKTFVCGRAFYIPDYSSVRQVHIRIFNTGSAHGVKTYTKGTWVLAP